MLQRSLPLAQVADILQMGNIGEEFETGIGIASLRPRIIGEVGSSTLCQ